MFLKQSLFYPFFKFQVESDTVANAGIYGSIPMQHVLASSLRQSMRTNHLKNDFKK